MNGEQPAGRRSKIIVFPGKGAKPRYTHDTQFVFISSRSAPERKTNVNMLKSREAVQPRKAPDEREKIRRIRGGVKVRRAHGKCAGVTWTQLTTMETMEAVRNSIDKRRLYRRVSTRSRAPIGWDPVGGSGTSRGTIPSKGAPDLVF